MLDMVEELDWDAPGREGSKKPCECWRALWPIREDEEESVAGEWVLDGCSFKARARAPAEGRLAFCRFVVVLPFGFLTSGCCGGLFTDRAVIWELSEESLEREDLRRRFAGASFG